MLYTDASIMKGTIYFMAAEAILRRYKFKTETSKLKKTNKSFCHNPIHDMESIFWVIFYVVINVESKVNSARKKIIDMLFTGLEGSALVRKEFVSDDDESDAWEYYVDLVGVDRNELLEELQQLTVILTKYYKEAEANLPNGPIDDSKMSGIHKEFMGVWRACTEYFEANGDVRIESGSQTERVRTSVKREAEPDPQPPRTSKRMRTCVSDLQFIQIMVT